MRHLSNCAAGSVVDGKSGELRDIRANDHRTLKDKREEKKREGMGNGIVQTCQPRWIRW